MTLNQLIIRNMHLAERRDLASPLPQMSRSTWHMLHISFVPCFISLPSFPALTYRVLLVTVVTLHSRSLLCCVCFWMGFCMWSLGQASQLDPSSIKYVRPAFVCARMGPVVNRLHNAPSQLSMFYGELAPRILRNLQCSRLPSWHSWHLLVFPRRFSLRRYLGSSSIKHSMWRRSQPLCHCSNCELEAMKGKLKLQ